MIRHNTSQPDPPVGFSFQNNLSYQPWKEVWHTLRLECCKQNIVILNPMDHVITLLNHYCDVIMGAMASQITSFTIIYSAVHWDPDQWKHQSPASLAFVRGNLPVTGGFPSQRASNAENVSIWWRHHVTSHKRKSNIRCDWRAVSKTMPYWTQWSAL